MTKESVTTLNELFLVTGILAAHASAEGASFRQRDVKFFTELLNNWAEPDQNAEIAIQNVQIQRYLKHLERGGYLKRTNKGARPTFRFTRVGLLEVLTRLVDSKKGREPAHFLFLVFFLKGYRERISTLIKRESEQFPPAMQIELNALMDISTLILREVKSVDQQIAKLEVRVEGAHKTSTLVSGRLKSSVPFADIVHEIEKKMPYEFNSRKPLRELISSIQPDQREWELLEGNRMRATIIWEPTKKILQEYRSQLLSLLN